MAVLKKLYKGYKLLVRMPQQCTEEMIDAVEELVIAGNEVGDISSLRSRIKRTRYLGFAYYEGEVVAVGAVKVPNESYAAGVFDKAGVPELYDEYPYELGWFYVVPEHRQHGIMRVLAEMLIKSEPQVFATSRVDNVPVTRLNKVLGLRVQGTPYRSLRGNYYIQLWG